MIRIYSQRRLSPYYGQVQIAESGRARALTLDGENWEIQFRREVSEGFELTIRHTYIRVAIIKDSDLTQLAIPSSLDARKVDERIQELSAFLKQASLPFPANDLYEYWLMDDKDDQPLALIFSCCSAEQMTAFPVRPEWTALPASVMKIQSTPKEEASASAPVNYQVERMVAERAGRNPQARWFKRCPGETTLFPNYLLSEDWEDEAHHDLCQRYILRQAPRLLMLHHLGHTQRRHLENAARQHALEVERFYPLYPEVADKQIMTAIRVEARMRQSVRNSS